MPYVHRDPQGNIDAIFAVPQPGYAEELVPPGTTLTELNPGRVAREIRALVQTFPQAARNAVKTILPQLIEYVAAGQKSECATLVNSVGVLPVLDPASKAALVAKIQELT